MEGRRIGGLPEVGVKTNSPIGILDVGGRGRVGSPVRILNPSSAWIPDKLVELDLKPDRKIVLQHPVGKSPQVQFPPNRGEKKGPQFSIENPTVKPTFPDHITGPLVVCTVLEDELHLVPMGEVVQV